MALARLKSIVTGCAIAVACGLAVAGCGEEPGLEEPAREGLAIDIGGIDYDVYITRQLNLAIPPDEAYYDGPPAEPGHALYGIFIEVCNNDSEEALTSTDDFVVEDNQGNEFEPIDLPEENPFAYQPRELVKEDCIPEEGSVAEQGPVSASMLLFDFPLENTENRPLELIISPPAGGGEPKRVELDL
ncbi:hypothetical protein BH20ACT19_BH20ACT19_06510 [soil metagenome]